MHAVNMPFIRPFLGKKLLVLILFVCLLRETTEEEGLNVCGRDFSLLHLSVLVYEMV